MELTIGTKVLIKNRYKDYLINAGRIKTITALLSDFGKKKAFELDNDVKCGIWLKEDFECIIGENGEKIKIK